MSNVSFLMSNYKTPPMYLRRALDSMLAQTFTDFEAVVVNDGVKDESYDLLREYAARDSRIRLIENERNLGLAASLNRGMDACTGQYIARMDTDDICLPERLALQTAYMDDHPDVMFAGAWADIFSENEEDVLETCKPHMCPQEEYRIRQLFANDPLLIHPTVIFRRSFLQQYRLRYSEDPRYRYAEDYEMWTRCADHGRAGILEQVVLRYRNTPSENRISVRHGEEMAICNQNVQIKRFLQLGIPVADYPPELNAWLLTGRKPYDIRYKKWMNTILARNEIICLFDQALMRKLFHRRWSNIVYYGIAYEKNTGRRIRMFLSLYPGEYIRFVKELRKKPNEINAF
ncbi:MAG: glycosyltransferase [Clostridia bacterium]|nr:glycosyltransferase [Clostridia bacterium]